MSHRIKLVGGPMNGMTCEVSELKDAIILPDGPLTKVTSVLGGSVESGEYANHCYDLQSLFGYPIWQDGYAVYEYSP